MTARLHPPMSRSLATGMAVLVALCACVSDGGKADRTDAFIERLEHTHPHPSDLATADGRRTAIAHGENICGLLSKGFTPDEVMELGPGTGMDAAAVEPLVDAATTHLCPHAN